MSEIGECCSHVANRLRLRYPPLGILFTGKPPANAQKVNNATFCELVVRSLKSGKTLYAGPDDIDCLVGAATLRLKPVPKEVVRGLVEAKHFGPYTL